MSVVASLIFWARQCTVSLPSVIPEYSVCTSRGLLAVVLLQHSILVLDPLSPAVRSIQSCNLSGHGRPLQITPWSISSPFGHQFIPFHQLVHESQMWLYNHIESSCTHEAVSSRETHVLTCHDLSYTYCCGTRYANTTVHQCCTSIRLSTA